jgi:hypothetical protein
LSEALGSIPRTALKKKQQKTPVGMVAINSNPETLSQNKNKHTKGSEHRDG